MPNAAGGSSGSAGDAQSESYSQLTGLKVIFDSIDLDQSGTLSRSELEAVLKKIGEEEDERTLGRLLDAFTQSDEEITFKKFVTEITRPRKRNAAGNAALFLLLIVLPFLYHFVVSLPFMFLALDVVNPSPNGTNASAFDASVQLGEGGPYGRGGTLMQTSIIMLFYQASRSFANALIGWSGGRAGRARDPYRIFFLPQSLLAAAGYLISALIDHEGSPWFLFLFVLVGLSETIVTLQVAVVAETKYDNPVIFNEAVQSNRLRVQYLSVSLGATFAFIIGGSMYTSSGFVVVCWLGFGVSVANFCAGFLYKVLRARDSTTFELDDKHDQVLAAMGKGIGKGIAKGIATVPSAIAARVASSNTEETPNAVAAARPETSTKLKPAMMSRLKTTFLTMSIPKPQVHVKDVGLAGGIRRIATKLAGLDALADTIYGEGPADWALEAVESAARCDIEMTSILLELLGDEEAIGAKHLAVLLNLVAGSGNIHLAEDDEIVQRVFSLFEQHGHCKKGDTHLTREELVSFLLPRAYLKLHPEASSDTKVVYPYLRLAMYTHSYIALCVGALSTSVLYYEEVYDYSSADSGIVLGLGEACAAVMICTTWTFQKLAKTFTARKKRQERQINRQSVNQQLALKKTAMPQIPGLKNAHTCCSRVFVALMNSPILQRPLHGPVLVCITGILMMGYTAPSLAVAIACQISLGGFADVGVTLLNEMTAASAPPREFQWLQAVGQTFRRIANCCTAFLGPLLFSINPQLPFLVAGGLTAGWAAFVLYPSMLYHARRITVGQPKGGFPPITTFAHFTASRPWHLWEQEYNHRRANSK